MPRRMLRHRVIAQCARLAFGVSVPDIQREHQINKPRGIAKIGQSFNKNRTQFLKKLLIESPQKIKLP